MALLTSKKSSLTFLVVHWLGLLTTLHTPASATTYHSWCYTESSSKTISCPGRDSILSVIRAFAGVSRQRRSDFCQFPTPSAEDCLLSEYAKTDFYRKHCNTFNTCSFYVNNPPIKSCGFGYDGDMYLFIEYTCQPVTGSDGNHYPIIDSCNPNQPPVEAPSVTLYSSNYPMYGQPIQPCALTVRSSTWQHTYPTNTSFVKVRLRDLAHEDVDNNACPYSLQYGMRGERMCATRGSTYMTVRVESGSLLQFHTNGYQPLGRYWIEVTADTEGETIIVQHRDYQHQPQPTTPTTTSTTFPPTPTTRPTTSTAPKPTTTGPTSTTTSTPTTQYRVTEPGWPVQQETTRPPYIGRVTEQQTFEPRTVTIRLPADGSSSSTSGPGTGVDVVMNFTTRGPQQHDQVPTIGEKEVGTQEMPLAISINIVIGGAVAGAVIVVLVIVCVAICVKRKRTPKKRRPDLGYMVHANMAIADKLHTSAGSLRTPASKKRTPLANSGGSRQPPTTSPPPMPTGGSVAIVGADHLRSAALRHTGQPSYKNVNRSSSKNLRKSTNRKSISQTTLRMGDSSESLDIEANFHGAQNSRSSAAEKPGDPYAISGVFAGFPRWVEQNPRTSGSGGDPEYDLFTSTLPAKLNKKPMPLPKPRTHQRRHHTASSINISASSPNVSPPPGGMRSRSRSPVCSSPESQSPSPGGRARSAAYLKSRSISPEYPDISFSSSMSIQDTTMNSSFTDFGTTKSTDALYAVVDKKRKSRGENDDKKNKGKGNKGRNSGFRGIEVEYVNSSRI